MAEVRIQGGDRKIQKSVMMVKDELLPIANPISIPKYKAHVL